MSHSVDEAYSVYEKKRIVARQEHHCAACGDAILAGDTYARTFFVHDGNPHTVKRCLRCDLIFDALVDKLAASGQWPDEDLNCGHLWKENFDEDPPPEIAQLAFMTKAEVQALVQGASR